jgi:hypothetical protein
MLQNSLINQREIRTRHVCNNTFRKSRRYLLITKVPKGLRGLNTLLLRQMLKSDKSAGKPPWSVSDNKFFHIYIGRQIKPLAQSLLCFINAIG